MEEVEAVEEETVVVKGAGREGGEGTVEEAREAEGGVEEIGLDGFASSLERCS